MRMIADIVGTRIALFATVAWQMCVAPVWLERPGAAAECEVVAECVPVMTCERWTCGSEDPCQGTVCYLRCKNICDGQSERLEKGPGNKSEPPKRVVVMQPATFMPPILATGGARRAPQYVETTSQPDLDRLRTVVLIM